MKKLKLHTKKFWKAKRKLMRKKMLSFENNVWQKPLKNQNDKFEINCTELKYPEKHFQNAQPFFCLGYKTFL